MSQSANQGQPLAADEATPNGKSSHGGELVLSSLFKGSGSLRCKVAGALTYATLFALEQAISRFNGVTFVNITPESGDEAILSLFSENPERVLRDILKLPGFRIRLEES
ncbi:MAG TPA: hypothetical protein VFC51_08045 [Chloroflexota bacterium]|nr:hypothetical protein [Chloroflexota bacterium]